MPRTQDGFPMRGAPQKPAKSNHYKIAWVKDRSEKTFRGSDTIPRSVGSAHKEREVQITAGSKVQMFFRCSSKC